MPQTYDTSKEQLDTTIADWRRKRIRWDTLVECLSALVIATLLGCLVFLTF